MRLQVPPLDAAGPQGPFGTEQLLDRGAVRILPFDYGAEFPLTGTVGNLVQDVINISVEGVFVAVAIGYGLDPEVGEGFSPIRLGGQPPFPAVGNLSLDNIPPDLLVEGFRLHPDLAVLLRRDPQRTLADIPLDLVPEPLQRLRPVSDFHFLLNIVDSATGRELQNEPVHSLATLGAADGRRPFKMLPQPMVFMPRSTLRLQIEERSAGIAGRLHLTLQGYKVLGRSGHLEEVVRQLGKTDPKARAPVYRHEYGDYRHRAEVALEDRPNTRLVPFDYVSTLDLTGREGNLVEDEVPVNIDGGYVAKALSYSLDAGDPSVTLQPPPSPNTPSGNGGAPVHGGDFVDLKGIRLEDIQPRSALIEGVRLHPRRVRFAFGCDGRPAMVARDMLGRLFERRNRSAAVRFLYTITDTGTGRDLQSRPVFNIAGLGIADGERPFRVLHRPMVFLPRSVIRVEVIERFGRGRLYLVFQGYKILSGGDR
jgi:hypothetical protein